MNEHDDGNAGIQPQAQRRGGRSSNGGTGGRAPLNYATMVSLLKEISLLDEKESLMVAESIQSI